jgi:hypothetical protein
MGLIKAKSETAAGTKCASNWTSRWAENQKNTNCKPGLVMSMHQGVGFQ